jgi:hypothetical protein
VARYLGTSRLGLPCRSTTVNETGYCSAHRSGSNMRELGRYAGQRSGLEPDGPPIPTAADIRARRDAVALLMARRVGGDLEATAPTSPAPAALEQPPASTAADLADAAVRDTPDGESRVVTFASSKLVRGAPKRSPHLAQLRLVVSGPRGCRLQGSARPSSHRSSCWRESASSRSRASPRWSRPCPVRPCRSSTSGVTNPRRR